MKQARILGSIVFGGELDPDPDGATDALRKAGFQVTQSDALATVRGQQLVNGQLRIAP